MIQFTKNNTKPIPGKIAVIASFQFRHRSCDDVNIKVNSLCPHTTDAQINFKNGNQEK